MRRHELPRWSGAELSRRTPPWTSVLAPLFALATLVTVASADEVEDDVSALLEGMRGTVVVDGPEGRRAHAPERAARRFVPASTFKIPNALIALDSGAVLDADHRFRWDGIRPESGFWAQSWSRDHTLATALRDGVLWYFQEVARRVGPARMNAYVRRFAYGNADTAGPIDRFWLDGPLAISAVEQVEFLRRFHEGRLGLSKRSSRIARQLLIREQNDSFTLSGKMGTAPRAEGGVLGWFVGYVEQPGRVDYFALNLDCPSFERCDHATRRRIVLDVLGDWGVLP